MKFKKKIGSFVSKYRHAWVLLYIFIYMPWFLWLEKREYRVKHFIIHSPLDDYIPFVEYFIIPYLLWFIFIAAAVIYFFLTDRKGFYSLTAFLFIGMTIFLIISTFYPNGLNLRPTTFARDNIFVDLVRQLYRTDTPTNVLPSIHVFNTIGVCIALKRSKAFSRHKVWRAGSLVLGFLIILATMFLKQHSVTDVIAAIALAAVLYQLVYAAQDRKALRTQHERSESNYII